MNMRGDEYAMYRKAIIERNNEAKSFLKSKISYEDPLVGIIAEAILDRINNPKRYSEYEEALLNIWHICEKAANMDSTVAALQPFARFSIAAECEPDWQRCFDNFEGLDDIRTAKAEFAKLSKSDAFSFFAETALKSPIRYIKNPPIVSEQMYVKYRDLIEAKFKKEKSHEDYGYNRLLWEKLKRAPEQVIRLQKSNMEDYYGRRIFPAYATIRLKCFDHPMVIPILVELLRNDESRAVRESAAEGINDPAGLPYLRDAASKDERPEVREAAIRKLVELDGVNSVEVFISALSDEESGIRAIAAEALGNLKSRKALESLKKALIKEKQVRGELALVIGKIDLNELLTFLNSDDVILRRYIADTLKELADPRAGESLLQALNDEDFIVRGNAAEALGEIKEKKAIIPLRRALKQGDRPYIRGSAAKALGEIGDTDSIELLAETLGDEEPRVREEAVRALEKMGDERALKALEKTKLDKDTMVRIKSQDAIKAINKRLQQKRLNKY
jgi:HEAT repeat protein